MKKTRKATARNQIGSRIRQARLECNPPVSQEDLAGRLAAKGNQRVLTMLSKLNAGDCVLGFFDFKYQSFARLVGRAKSPDLANKLWGSMEWNEIIFMGKPIAVAVEATKLQPYLCSTYRGATRISSERVEKIIQDFGSLESFLLKHFEKKPNS